MIIRLTLLLFSVCSSLYAQPISHNDPSAYIRMHVDDAVQWQTWDASILSRARKENKLIMISSGYFACHWCHVMQKESFKNASVAELLNRNYIPVKIDRENHPELDAYLIDFMSRAQGYAGWPLNVFVTPEGYPLTGVVYLQTDKFIRLLEKLERRWRTDTEGLKEIAENVFEYQKQLYKKSVTFDADEMREAFLQQTLNEMDELSGGFGDQAKFPMSQRLLLIMQLAEENDEQQLADFVKLSLHQMASLGLNDFVRGGFFRYTVDPGWATPHFEKMLYTNAAMIELYATAARIYDNRNYLEIAKNTLDFVLREMADAEGGFVSALTAQDSLQREGESYLWSEADIRSALQPAELQWVDENLKLMPVAHSERKLLTGMPVGKTASQIRQRLLQLRPHSGVLRDEKFVLAWNAYLLSSMVDLLAVEKVARYQEAAERLARRIRNRLLMPAKGIKPLSMQQHVMSVYALWKWSSFSESGLKGDLLGGQVRQIIQRYYSDEGWRISAEEVLPMPGRSLSLKDGNLPAADGRLMALVKHQSVSWQALYAKELVRVNLVDSMVLDSPAEYASGLSSRLLEYNN